MSKHDTIRESLDSNGLGVQVSPELFEDFMDLQLRFETAGCRIQFEFGRPSAGLMDGSAKVLSISEREWEVFVPMLLELLVLFEREVEEDGMQAVFVDDIAEFRVILPKILEADQSANKDEKSAALVRAKEVKFTIQEKLGAEKGQLNATALNDLLHAGVNRDLVFFVADKMTKGQVVALQELCRQSSAFIKDEAEAIMLGVDGAQEVVDVAAAKALEEADAARKATEIILQDSARGRFVYMLGKASRSGVADAIFVLAATLDPKNRRDSWYGYEQALIDYGIIDGEGNFIDDAEAEIRDLCAESVDLLSYRLTNPDTQEPITFR